MIKKYIYILRKNQQKSYENSEILILKKNFKMNIWKIKKYRRVRDHCHYSREYRGAAHKIRHLKYNVPKKISIVFHNGSYYDYHFIVKELAEEFKKQFTCLRENTKKYITFLVPVEKKWEQWRTNYKKYMLHIEIY